MTPHQPDRVPALDGLRALAISLVLMRHSLSLFFGENYGFSHEVVVSLFGNGWMGVDLFFVLSGFLMMRSLILHPTQSWKTYLGKRALRIFPAYYAALLLTISGLVPFFSTNAPNQSISFLYHLIFLQDYLPNNLNVALWSLGVEEKFYLFLLPLAAMLAWPLFSSLRKRLILVAALIGLSPLLRIITLMFVGMPQNYYDFLIHFRYPFHACFEPLFSGVLIAFIKHHAPKEWQDVLTKRARLVFFGGGALLLMLLYGGNRMDAFTLLDVTIQPTMVAAAAALLVLGAVYGGAPPFFSSSVTRWMAKLSYSIYLVHILVLPLSFFITQTMLGSSGFLIFYGCFLGVYLMLSTMLALALYHGVEKWGLALKARL